MKLSLLSSSSWISLVVFTELYKIKIGAQKGNCLQSFGPSQLIEMPLTSEQNGCSIVTCIDLVREEGVPGQRMVQTSHADQSQSTQSFGARHELTISTMFWRGILILYPQN